MLQGFTSQLRQNNLGQVGRGVHQHTAIDGDKKIRLAPLPKIENPLMGIHIVNDPPRLSHLNPLFNNIFILDLEFIFHHYDISFQFMFYSFFRNIDCWPTQYKF